MNSTHPTFQRCSLLLVLVGACTIQAQDTNETRAVLERFGVRPVGVHDPSTIVKCGDEYWVFNTGQGIISHHSKDLEHWEFGPHVITNRLAWATNAVPRNRGQYWAPDLLFLNGRYLLYFSVSTFGTNVSAIGLATTPTLDPADPHFGWADQGLVIQSRSTNNFNTIDPAITLDADGKLWLAFGSFWSGIKLVELDPTTGKRIAEDSPIYSLASKRQIEASYIYRHDNFYYLFVNWGACCRGVNSTYNIRVGRSSRITGPYLDADGVDLAAGGGTLFLDTHGPFIGPGHAAIFTHDGAEWFSCHYYDGTRRGASMLAIMPLKWDNKGWPEVAASQAPAESGGNSK